ncbi:MAG: hypothetical protein AB4050_12040 [Synechococcus sp.]
MPPLKLSKRVCQRLSTARVAFGLGVGMVVALSPIAVSRFPMSQFPMSRWAIAPANAHQVQVADDIGGTLHIEPNDRPRAGESVLMWFALTRRGGSVLQLGECDCRVQVFAQPLVDTTPPIASPQLKPVSAESYTDIPGATVTFPDIGAYTIVISGTSTTSNDFQPFELSFDITVVSR